MDMAQAEAFLNDLPHFTSKNPMIHTVKYMKALGNPQESFPVIHVAGSNGKGSVCCFLFHMLLENGNRAGLFTSPHLVDVRERFQLNDGLCSREDFLEAFASAKAAADRMHAQGEDYPTYFEMIFAIGMLIFQKHNIDILVMETGLGGRLDTTNVIKRPEICVITSISLEHVEYLGHTIEQIASEKAGIIKEGVPVVYDGSDDAASAVIGQTASRMHADAFRVVKNMFQICEIDEHGIDFLLCTDYDKKTVWRIPFTASYQVMNATLAVTAFRMLISRGNLHCEHPDEVIRNGLLHTVWPGRMQEVGPGIYFDGAHNVGGIIEFTDNVKRLCAHDRERPLLLFSMVRDKDYESCVHILSSTVDWEEVLISRITDERGLECRTLAAAFPDTMRERVHIQEDCGIAFAQMRQKKRDGQKLFAAGSLYFIGALLKELKNQP